MRRHEDTRQRHEDTMTANETNLQNFRASGLHSFGVNTLFQNLQSFIKAKKKTHPGLRDTATAITKLTRKPVSNSIAYWSLRHGDSPQRGTPYPYNCFQQGRPKDKYQILLLESWRNVAIIHKFAPRSAVAAKVSMSDTMNKYIAQWKLSKRFLNGRSICMNHFRSAWLWRNAESW